MICSQGQQVLLPLLSMIPLIRRSKNRRFVQFPAASICHISRVLIPVASFPFSEFLHYLLAATHLSADD